MDGEDSMIPNCHGLDEAITYVQDLAVKEELEYQYDKLRRDYEEVVAHELELESNVANLEDLQDDYDAMEERADEYESDAESYNDMADILRDISGHKISTMHAQEVLNSLLEIMGSKKCEVTNLAVPDCDEVIHFE